jgi:hypothetical protein
MGFRPEKTLYKLTFEGTSYEGLVVRAGCCTVGEFNDMVRGFGAYNTADSNDRLFELFLKYLNDWNLEDPDTGEPVPYTLDGIHGVESQLMSAVVNGWQKAMVGVPRNLSLPSSDGGTLLESSLQLDSVSGSL